MEIKSMSTYLDNFLNVSHELEQNPNLQLDCKIA